MTMFRNANLYITTEIKLSDAILLNPYLMLMLEHFGIELPLQEKTIAEICLEKFINTELFLTFANLYNGNNYSPAVPFSFSDIHSIISYLKNSHKYYSEEIYPTILQNIRQMTNTETYKEMALVEKFFETYFKEVKEHLDYENTIVFPYMLTLYADTKISPPITNHDQYSVNNYKEQHNDIEEKLDDLKNLIIKYLPPDNDRTKRRRLLLSLYELEFDLNIHSQIEDLILIPLVVKMESQLFKNK